MKKLIVFAMLAGVLFFATNGVLAVVQEASQRSNREAYATLEAAIAAKREALLHRIQQLTLDRVMFAPIWSTRVLIGVGPRIADHTINLVPLSIWPSYEDMTLKNKQ